MEDQEIVDKIWERKEEGLTDLTSKYEAYCCSISYGILRNHEDSAECVNDTWLRVWNAIPPSRPENLPAFLAKVVRNLSLNCYEKKHAKKRGEGVVNVLLDELEQCIPGNNQIEEHLNHQHLVECIQNFLKKQSKQKRQIFMRRYFYMDDIKEVATKMGMREGSVKSALSRMRKELCSDLEKEGIML